MRLGPEAVCRVFRERPRVLLRETLGHLKKGLVFLLVCSGLGVVSLLAPFGAARMHGGMPAGFVRPVSGETGSAPRTTPQEAACRMLQDRFRVLLDGQVESIRANYDTSSEPGLWTLEREEARVRYLSQWAGERGLSIVDVKARIEIDGVSPANSGGVWVELTEHALYTYAPKQGEWTHTFGSRAVHVMELVLCGGEWKIRRDWYSDPLAGEHGLEPCKFPDGWDAGKTREDGNLHASQGSFSNKAGQYDREAALEYAIRYAGVPAVEGSGRYNPAYKVYTFAGGDCANFASQVLHAGGLKQGYGWHYTSEGSAAWVRGEDLVWHLLSTGRAERIYSGDFSGAVEPTAEYPYGAVSVLEPGDLIAYETKGQICHVAVVVGKDPAGYVTIASHTADRLFFPWDVGWNDTTVFWLLKIVY